MPEQIKLLKYSINASVEAFSTMRFSSLPYPVIQAKQCHGTGIAVINSYDTKPEELENIDALITQQKGIAIGVRTADCVPILLYDPVCKAIAAIHAGWRGTVAKIAKVTIEKMAELYGSKASDMTAVIGPSISMESFQVGEELADAFRDAGFPMDKILKDMGTIVEKTNLPAGTKVNAIESPMRGGLHIDLWEANKYVLEDCGIQRENIQISGICTYLRNDLFYSARRETIACPRIISAIKMI